MNRIVGLIIGIGGSVVTTLSLGLDVPTAFLVGWMWGSIGAFIALALD